MLLIGDRAIQSREQGAGSKEFPCSPLPAPCSDVWDLGEKWLYWTGLPFVFAAWVARPEVNTIELETQLAATRDRGVAHLAEIAAAEAPLLGIGTDLAFHYLRDNLHFTLGEQEFTGLERFAQLCAQREFVPKASVRALTQISIHGCSKR